MAILTTTAETRRYAHTSDGDVDVQLPTLQIDDDVVAQPARWISVDEVAQLDGSIALGATVVSIKPLNGADYYRTQALMPTTADDRAAYGLAIVETARAGIAKIEGFDGAVEDFVASIRADLLDELAAIIVRASRGRSV